MGSLMHPRASSSSAGPPAYMDPSVAQRAALQKAETDRKLREARGRRSMFLTTDGDRQTGRQNGSTPILGG